MAQGAILRWGLRLLSATWRYREDVPPECRGIVDGNETAAIAFWHGRMLPVWHRFRAHKGAALVSGSRDGELLAGYLRQGLGYREVIRGSSSRGGSEALAAMVAALEHRSCLITPDGPRGPAREAKAGALVAAARAGRRVLAVGWNCRRAWRLRSWDGMEIPYPFSIINFRYCIFDMPESSATSDSHRHSAPSASVAEGRVRISGGTLQAFSQALTMVNQAISL